MGQHISCHQFYCPSLDYQPEWFSSSNYKILTYETKYSLERGILKILSSPLLKISLSKYLLFHDITEFSIPLYFQKHHPYPIHIIFSIYSQNPISNSFLYIEFILNKTNIEIWKNGEKIMNGKIKENVIYGAIFHFTKIKEDIWKIHFEFKRKEKSMMVKEWSDIFIPCKDLSLYFQIHNKEKQFSEDDHFSLSLDSF
jgi:hypothetical protein